MTKCFKLLAVCIAALALHCLSGAAAPVAGGAYNVVLKHQAGKSSIAPGSETAYAMSVLDSIAARAGSRIGKISVCTYGSPEGTLAWNTKLAGLRSAKVVDLIKEKYPFLPDSCIVVKTVPEDWDSAVRYLKSGDKAWKDEALQIIRAGGEKREEKLQDLWAGEAWDDLLWNCFYFLRRTEVSIDFASDFEFSESSAPAKSGEYLVGFPVGRTSVQSWYGENKQILAELQSLANTENRPAGIVIDSYSSPEGRTSWNLVLARRRAESVKNALVAAGYPADAITINSCVEDWEGLRDGVASTYFGTEKSDILSILDDSSLSADERKARLVKLSGGAVWNRLITGWMGGLRRVKISFTQ
jgi:outer membrane protein OmpA-like peptidoglycan-associated protein